MKHLDNQRQSTEFYVSIDKLKKILQFYIRLFSTFFYFTAFINMQELNKKLKKKAQYERFSQTILPNDWKQEAKKRPRNERNIWRFYIIQLLLRTILDVFFTWLQFKIYPFRFIVPEVYICGGEMPETRADPCPHKVDCFVSRPMEKTVFFLYFYIVAAICLIINIVELWYIGFYRLR